MDIGLLLAARVDVSPFSAPAPAGEPEPLSPSATPPSGDWIRGALRAAAHHQRSGHPERVWPIFRVLEPLLPQLAEADPASAGRVISALATQALLEGDVEAFLERARRAAAALDRAGDGEAAGVEHASLGAGYRALGGWDEAERALDAAASAKLDAVVARVALDRARVRSTRGDHGQARVLAAEAAAMFAVGGDAVSEGVARGYLAGILVAAGDLAATPEAERACALLAGSLGGRAFAGAALARALLAEGRPADALAAAEQAAADLTRAGHLDEGEITVRLALVDARARAGDAAGAARALGEARRRVLADAYKLRDPGLRRGFLEDVPELRRALETPT